MRTVATLVIALLLTGCGEPRPDCEYLRTLDAAFTECLESFGCALDGVDVRARVHIQDKLKRWCQ